MNARHVGSIALLIGVLGLVATVCLALFFVSQFQNIHELMFMGTFNDILSALSALGSAVLAFVLSWLLRARTPRVGTMLVIGVWVGTAAVSYGTWLIVAGNGDLERSSYFYFFGNGLIGVWLLALNLSARRQQLWPLSVTLLGLVSGSLMLVGLLGLYGLLAGLEGNAYSTLVLVCGISFLGIGLLYPIWCLWLGRLLVGSAPGHAVSTITMNAM